MTSSSWPKRTAICLDCRTVMPRGVACPLGHAPSRVRSLTTEDGREQVRLAVWGPAAVAVASEEGSRGSGASFLDWFDFPDVDGLWIIFVVALAVVLWLCGGWLVQCWRRWRYERTLAGPFGAPCEPSLAAARGPIGVVRAIDASGHEPVTQRPCVAYSARLTYGRTKEVMLRDGLTTGFEVAIAGGGKVRVPPGVVVIDDGAFARTRSAARLYASGIEAKGVGSPRELFPHDAFELTVLAPGDGVEVLSRVRRAGADPSSHGTYRHAPEVLYECEGPVVLRRVAAPAVEEGA